jgi:glycine/serine hydroxymethyltransferase
MECMTANNACTTDTFDVLEALEASPGLNLFPTENRMSPRALRAVGTPAVQRYPGAEGPGFFYGDPAGFQRVYDYCTRLAQTFFEARHAFVQFLSGLHTANTVLSAMASAGDWVLIMDPSCGGHYATGGICERLGLRHAAVPFDRARCAIDVEALGRMVRRTEARLVYLDVSTLIRLPPMREIRCHVPEEVKVCLDASQVLGLVPYAADRIGLETGVTSISGSTHKSFPGPQKGVFVTNDERAAEAMAAVLPLCVSSAHANNVGALAITLEELMPVRCRYGCDIVANARALARALAERGFEVPGKAFGYSESHQVWIAPPADVDAVVWGRRLQAAGIRTTVVTLPATDAPGLRLGVQEVTRVGMTPETMPRIADLFARILRFEEEPATLCGEVEALISEYPDVHYVADRPCVIDRSL